MITMGKTYNSKTGFKANHRQPFALIAKARKAGVMHDRRQARGGARNDQADLMEEWEEYKDDLDEVG